MSTEESLTSPLTAITSAATEVVKSALKAIVHVTPSGINHPYYGITLPSASSEMFARVTSYPALGHETIIPHGQEAVKFNVLIETESSEDTWEAQLWHNSKDSHAWEALPLERSKNLKLEVVQTSQALRRLWFTGSLHGTPTPLRPVSFTVKFRTESQSGWKWAQTESGADDGQLLYQAPPLDLAQQKDLSHYLDGLSSDLKVEPVKSDTPNTKLWSLTAKVVPAEGEKSGFSTHLLGLPTDFVRWFSLVRIWSPWLAPRQGKGLPFAEKDGVLYSFLRDDGLHVVILAISGVDDVLTILKQEGQALAAYARNDREEDGVARIVVTVGETFQEALAASIYHARSIVSKYEIFSAEEHQMIDEYAKEEEKLAEERDVHANWVQDWYDGFTFCTWNALGQNLTEGKVLGALESLETNGIRITNLIIDDNWQSLDHEGEGQFQRGWKAFEANSEGFPNGLKHAVSEIRQKYPDIKHVAVWHAMLGYWGGISPTGELAKKYKTIKINKPEIVGGGEMLAFDAPDVHRMYNDFYAFLNRCRIDSVKTDAQFELDTIESARCRRELTTTYLRAWTIAQLRHFGGRAISCMSQTPPILFQCQLPRTLPALPVRNSDDFFPEIRESHPWHIFCNAHNALLTNMLNVLPDWDMFQTDHEWAGFHAAARCVSGGPVYVTDEPGKHNIGLIEQMTARTIRDQTVVLRCSVVGRSLREYVGYEEERLCIVAAYHGRKGTGFGVLGLFNCREDTITEILPLDSFMGVEDDTEYIVRSHKTGAISPPMTKADPNATIGCQVAGAGWEILTACPVTSPQKSAGSGIKLAVLGLIDKMTGVAAVINSHIGLELSGKRMRISATLKALGKFGVWISTLDGDNGDLEDKLMVVIEGRPIPWECVEVRKGGVLVVDLDAAWKKMGLKAGWSNEVNMAIALQV